MLSGNRPFGRVTVGETMGAILHAEPLPIEPSAGAVPVALRRLIERCLDKDPDKRLQSALDVVFALSDVTASPRATDSPVNWWWVRAGWFVAGAVVGAALAWLLALLR
jgi:serine/threonine-protein kinase